MFLWRETEHLRTDAQLSALAKLSVQHDLRDSVRTGLSCYIECQCGPLTDQDAFGQGLRAMDKVV